MQRCRKRIVDEPEMAALTAKVDLGHVQLPIAHVADGRDLPGDSAVDFALSPAILGGMGTWPNAATWRKPAGSSLNDFQMLAISLSRREPSCLDKRDGGVIHDIADSNPAPVSRRFWGNAC